MVEARRSVSTVKRSSMAAVESEGEGSTMRLDECFERLVMAREG